MRKWIVAVVLVAVLGTTAVVWWPKSVIELRKEYTTAWFEWHWADRLQYKWWRIIGRPGGDYVQLEQRLKRMEAIERALIKAGYFERRAFPIPQRDDAFLVEIQLAVPRTWLARTSCSVGHNELFDCFYAESFEG